MRTLYETLDGKLFETHVDAERHERLLTEDVVQNSGLLPYLATLEDEYKDEWYGSDRERAMNVIQDLALWCVQNNKTVRLIDVN